MICLGLSQSRLNVAVIIIYTCILIPLRQLKEALERVFRLVSANSCEQEQQPITLEPFYVDLMCLELQGMNHRQMDDLPLPMVRFRELEAMREEESEVCSVCLVEFEREDEVTQLSRCGHVFHLGCIRSWVDRNRFTCPLCRSLLNVDVFS